MFTAVRISQKVPRTGKEDTAQGIRIAYIAYYPILYPGPLGILPAYSGTTGKFKGKESYQSEIGTLASPGYLPVTSPRNLSYPVFQKKIDTNV